MIVFSKFAEECRFGEDMSRQVVKKANARNRQHYFQYF